MTSQQATGDTSGGTFYDAPTQHEGGGNIIDETSQQAPVGTNATHSESGAVPAQQTGGNDDLAYEQDPVRSTANTSDQGELDTEGTGGNRGTAYEQAPLGATGNTSEARGANTQDETVRSDVNNQGAIVDDSFDTQVKSTKDKVVGGFQKMFTSTNKTTNTANQGVNDDSLETQMRNTKAQILGTPQVSEQDIHGALNPTRPTGGVNSGDDDSFETQVRSTGAQVVGTVQGIGSSLKLAGQKMKGSYAGVKDSSKKT